MKKEHRILVVDDDASIRHFIELALTDDGYEVACAPEGTSALEMAAGSPPSLILLDMRMPGMDGWRFAQSYRKTPGPHAPIVVLTAARDAAAYASEIEADGYLAKPFDLKELMRLVAKFAGAAARSERR